MTNKPRRADAPPYWASAVIATSTRHADDPRASDQEQVSRIASRVAGAMIAPTVVLERDGGGTEHSLRLTKGCITTNGPISDVRISNQSSQHTRNS
jgi:hypothetical protein